MRSEVLSALIQFPEWTLTWTGSLTPSLSGYQLMHGEYSVGVPRLHRWTFNRKLELEGFWTNDWDGTCWSPLAREC
jgi:hypothetical protein